MNDPYEKFYEVLKHFAGISRDEFNRVRSLFHKRQISKNSFFIQAGERPLSFAFIYSGLFRSFYITEKGEEFIKNFVRPNELIAAYSSYLGKTDSIVNIQALNDSFILECRFDEFVAKTEGILCWERFNRKLSDLLFIQREIREYELLTLNATERYKKFLEKFSAIESELNDYSIASYLGITPVSFSRIRKKNQKNSFKTE